jgi:hypothetical protein
MDPRRNCPYALGFGEPFLGLEGGDISCVDLANVTASVHIQAIPKACKTTVRTFIFLAMLPWEMSDHQPRARGAYARNLTLSSTVKVKGTTPHPSARSDSAALEDWSCKPTPRR